MIQRGMMDSINEDPFSVFVASTEIRYCYYAETEKILGNTFGMCVLQVSFVVAFERVTLFPNMSYYHLFWVLWMYYRTLRH